MRKSAFLLGVTLLAAACSSGSGDPSAGTLLTTTRPAPATTTTSTVAPPTTSIMPTTTTSPSTTTTAPATITTTNAPGTDVAAAGDGNTADTLVELPFTGAEPEVAVVALLALVLGVWLVRWSGIWQFRLARLEARRWRRPGAPSADPAQPPRWPPNAIDPASDSDRQFRRMARALADRHRVSFVEGVDAYATRWAASLDLLSESESDGDPVSRWRAGLSRELRRIYDA